MEKTVILSGVEIVVSISGQNCDIRNDGVDVVYASKRPSVVAGADGVVSIPAGQAVKLLDTCGTVYLMGTGSVQLCGNDYGYSVFKTAAASSGEGGGIDDIARNAINLHSANTDIHLTMSDVAACVSNTNLFDNPDFAINQRGKTSYSGANIYTVDRWTTRGQTVVTVNDGYITIGNENDDGAYHYIIQIFERAIPAGTRVTMSFEYRNAVGEWHFANHTGTLLHNATSEWTSISKSWILTEDVKGLQPVSLFPSAPIGSIDIRRLKLEVGGAATPFVPPVPAVELLKCQRYFVSLPVGAEILIGAAESDTTASVLLPLPVQMSRGNISVTAGGSAPLFRAVQNGSMLSGLAMTSAVATAQGVLFGLSGSFSSSHTLVAHNSGEFSLAISAEL